MASRKQAVFSIRYAAAMLYMDGLGEAGAGVGNAALTIALAVPPVSWLTWSC